MSNRTPLALAALLGACLLAPAFTVADEHEEESPFKKNDKGLISADLHEHPLHEALWEVSELSGVNVIWAPKLGLHDLHVTARVRNMGGGDLIKDLLDLHGLKYQLRVDNKISGPVFVLQAHPAEASKRRELDAKRLELEVEMTELEVEMRRLHRRLEREHDDDDDDEHDEEEEEEEEEREREREEEREADEEEEEEERRQRRRRR